MKILLGNIEVMFGAVCLCCGYLKCNVCVFFGYSRFTARVTEFMKVLDDLSVGKYERTMVASENNDSKAD